MNIVTGFKYLGGLEAIRRQIPSRFTSNMTKSTRSVPTGSDQTPEGIRRMFEGITPSYDRLNRFFSGALDVYWRKLLARELLNELTPCNRILDIATGTGDLAASLQKRAPNATITGLDFTRTMLNQAAKKYGSGATSNFAWIEGDGTRLPFPTGHFDACCVGFGLRNMADRPAALREMRRVVRPGGSMAVLEFSQPRNPIIRFGYDLYSLKIMPRLGKLLSGSDAYLYLPTSIRAFWNADELASQMRDAGWKNVRYRLLLSGVVAIHIGMAPAS